MTPHEIQIMRAKDAYYEAQIANLAHEGALKSAQAESLAIMLKAAQEELDALKKPKDNVVPIEDAKA